MSTKVHKTLQEKYDLLSNEVISWTEDRIACCWKFRARAHLGEVRREVNQLQEDTTAKFDELRALQTKYDRLSKQYDYLLDNNSTLIAASARENKALMDSTIQSRLQAKRTAWTPSVVLWKKASVVLLSSKELSVVKTAQWTTFDKRWRMHCLALQARDLPSTCATVKFM